MLSLLTNFFNYALKFIYIYIYILSLISVFLIVDIIGLIRYNDFGIILNDLGNIIVFCCSKKMFY